MKGVLHNAETILRFKTLEQIFAGKDLHTRTMLIFVEIDVVHSAGIVADEKELTVIVSNIDQF